MKTTPILASVLAAAGALALLASSHAPATAAPAPLLANGPIPISNLPFQCNEVGTYCLTTNLTASSDDHGIVVNADGVTIDLGGYELSGADTGTIGIYSANATDLTVRNGHIADWTEGAVSLSRQLNIEDVRIRGTSEFGILCGENSLLRRINLVGWMERGVQTGFESLVRDSHMVLHTEVGTTLRLGYHSRAEECFINGGAVGIEAFTNSAVRNCEVRATRSISIQTHERVTIDGVDIVTFLADGIEVQDGCTVTGCTVWGSPTDAIRVLGRENRIEGNNLRGNGTGLRVQGGHNLVIRNMAFDNGQDYVIAPLNSVGPILRDFMTITSTNPHANHATPLL